MEFIKSKKICIESCKEGCNWTLSNIFTFSDKVCYVKYFGLNWTFWFKTNIYTTQSVSIIEVSSYFFIEIIRKSPYIECVNNFIFQITRCVIVNVSIGLSFNVPAFKRRDVLKKDFGRSFGITWHEFILFFLPILSIPYKLTNILLFSFLEKKMSLFFFVSGLYLMNFFLSALFTIRRSNRY